MRNRPAFILPELVAVVLPLIDQLDIELSVGDEEDTEVNLCCGCGSIFSTGDDDDDESEADREANVELLVKEAVDGDEDSNERGNTSIDDVTVDPESTDVNEYVCPVANCELLVRNSGDVNGLEQVDDAEESGLIEPDEGDEMDVCALKVADDVDEPSMALGKFSTESRGVGGRSALFLYEIELLFFR